MLNKKSLRKILAAEKLIGAGSQVPGPDVQVGPSAPAVGWYVLDQLSDGTYIPINGPYKAHSDARAATQGYSGPARRHLQVGFLTGPKDLQIAERDGHLGDFVPPRRIHFDPNHQVR